ncbi:MAG TPA: aspartyl protease family protein [Pyrinomonadaceae bacterium]|nr:aspartyl protease family protein [Pyrinomonadaceae bacterium]
MRALKTALFVLALSLPSLHFRHASARQTAAGPTPVVEVPMLFRGPMPAVEVMVNGQGPFLFAIDTGGQGMARVDSTLVERLKLRQVGEVQAGDGSGRNTRSLMLVELDSITLGGVEFKGVRAASRNYNTSPNLPKIDGILGFNLFADYLLTLDFPARRVRLERGELPKPDGAEVLSFENPRGIPVVELSVGGRKVKAHIDSGNTVGAFMLPAALAEGLKFAAPPAVVGKARTISNEIEIKEGRLTESIRLGRFEFAGPTVTFPAVSDDANIGSKALRDFSLTFDQKNKSVKLKRQALPRASGPAPAAAQDFSDYPGKYGERTISAEGGALFLQRQGGPKLKLTSVAGDEFALEAVPEARVKFTRGEGGKVVAINILNRAGEWERAAREQP